MMRYFEKYSDNKKMRLGLKLFASVIIVFIALQGFFFNGLKSYYSIKEYSLQNDFADEQTKIIDGTTVSQHFIAQGNVISNLSVYLENADSDVLNITLSDIRGKVLHAVSMDLSDYTIGEWNKAAFDCKEIKRGDEYVLCIESDSGLGSLLLDTGERPGAYLDCELQQERVDAGLVIGIQQTYCYITWASGLELSFALLRTILLALALCYAVFYIEKLIGDFNVSEKRKGLLHAVYYAVTLVLLFNPIDTIRMEVQSFNRIIGAGYVANVDVSRRIDNFNHWFVYFAVSIILYYLLINHFMQEEQAGERRKIVNFMDQFIVLANINLLLRCITYFADQGSAQTVFYYSAAMIELIIMLCVFYLAAGLEKKITADRFMQLEVIAFCIAYPVSIISQKEWQAGKLLFGVQAVLMLSVIPAVYFFSGIINASKVRAIVKAGSIFGAFIPFATSFYIELINILNQHGIFIVRLRKYYTVGILLGAIFTFAAAVYIKKKGVLLKNWKTWSYSWIIFGIACLSAQIPLEDVYDAQIFESANASILISDFLNFGSIPLVEHYGGHMMTGVWEGLIYAVMNNDFSGAIFSPYAGYLMTILAVLFFFLVRKVWNEDMAFLATLFFPFYSHWSYYGLGMLVCLAAWAYIRKNTYPRAAVVWLAFIWCALYRLDLGFSIGFACMAAMAVYVFIYKNWRAARQLLLTLAVFGAAGTSLWTGLCIFKKIDPVDRLLEFLFINLSNRNWAYASIGNTGSTLFAWCYMIIPFAVIVCLIHTVFSEKFRKKAGREIWILLLILGFAYFTNFSRGVTRHSLSEQATAVVLWDAYIFIAVFAAAFKSKKQWFLPVFTLLIMCNTFFTTTDNFSQANIGDSAAEKTGNFTQEWTLDRFAQEDAFYNESAKTYWEQLKENGIAVTRTNWAETLESTIKPYAFLLNTLLDDDETFVDFINKTFVYSAIGRRNPAYVSQSPLQLSGEFTQEQFIEEIEGVPIVLMPLDSGNITFSLDGVANSYRYYKVSEYIYQNYVPFCACYTDFAVWCLPERLEEFRTKTDSLVCQIDYFEAFKTYENLHFENCVKSVNAETGNIELTCNGTDPGIAELQRFIDLSPYLNSDVRITIEYDTNNDGQMQLFYTSEKNEAYEGNKVITVDITGEGTAEFVIPVTEYTRLRLDIPEESAVIIKSLYTDSPYADSLVSYIDYGYDEPEETEDNEGGLHTYLLSHLPYIWAEKDGASSNRELCTLKNQNGIFVFDRDQIVSDEKGNYLFIHAAYGGNDTKTNYEQDDEKVNATVRVGIYDDGKFIEKYQYTFVVLEGANDYAIRISNDYNWYLDEVNAVEIISDDILHNIQMKILEGD